jgi:hypothetical protein
MAEGFALFRKGRFHNWVGSVAEADEVVKKGVYALIKKKYAAGPWPFTVDQDTFDWFGVEVFRVDGTGGNLFKITKLQQYFNAWQLRYIDGYDPEAEAALITAKANHYHTVAVSLQGLYAAVYGGDQTEIDAAMASALTVLQDTIEEG